MGTSDISDDISEWEDVPAPAPYSPASDPQQQEFRLVLRENYYDDGSSIFPPTEHEGLPVLLTDSKASEEDTLSVSDSDCPRQHQIKRDSRLSVIVRDFGIGITTVGGRMLKVLATNFRCQISSMRPGSVLVPGLVLAVALFACLKFLHWKNRLLLLIREKDQRINQLWSQVTEMNEMLSARRKVPISRIYKTLQDSRPLMQKLVPNI